MKNVFTTYHRAHSLKPKLDSITTSRWRKYYTTTELSSNKIQAQGKEAELRNTNRNLKKENTYAPGLKPGAGLDVDLSLGLGLGLDLELFFQIRILLQWLLWLQCILGPGLPTHSSSGGILRRSQASSETVLGLLLVGHETLPQRGFVQEAEEQTPDSPQLTPLDVEEQRLYSELLL
ncbi:hypothetical protein WMY93_033773, partial [Mugilogobius chulae]